MSFSRDLSRRDALKLTAAAALTLPVFGLPTARAASAEKPVSSAAKSSTRLRLGVAGFSLRDLTLEASLAVLKQLEIDSFTLYKAHVRIEEGTMEECRAGAQKFRDAGISLWSTGVVNLPNDEAKVRRAFDNARAAGLTMMTVKPDLDAFPLIERFVKEYNLTLAIHNHGPEDKVYPSPYDAWKAIQPYDARIGLCLDVGHTMRAGVDPVEAISKCRARLYDVHLKDSVAIPGAIKDLPIEAGHGSIDLRAICAALSAIKYTGVMGYEYEKVAVNPVMGLAESIGYVRGLMTGMAAA